jgi:DNA-binding CsgD family transcriptional regulator
MTVGDMRRKELALGRIKRLASSGLALEPFVRSVFELVNEAVPNNPNRTFHVGSQSPEAYICNSLELNKVIPLHNRYYVESPPNVSGAKFRVNPIVLNSLFPSKAIWTHEEITLPNLYQTEGYNVVFRPWGFHHCLMVMFQEGNEFRGCYPIWRSADQKPFGRDDVEFVRAAAPHISHGLKAAQLLARNGDLKGDDFTSLPGWGSGTILMDRNGNLIALDSTASLIFQQIGVFDGLAAHTFSRHPVCESLDYITRTLVSIFHEPEASSLSAGTPVSKLYIHWTGIVLRLRGVMLIGADGREYINILIERGETAEARRRRLIVRWGLSQREEQVLSFIGDSKTGPEIAILLRISHDTVRKHTSRILEKLGVETRIAAAAIALAAAPLSSE